MLERRESSSMLLPKRPLVKSGCVTLMMAAASWLVVGMGGDGLAKRAG